MKVICIQTGKHTYGEKAIAIREAERLSLLTGNHWRAYQCQHCHFYHLTSHRWRRQRRP
jgi:hypothetical protein